jgi:hypothetical protein
VLAKRRGFYRNGKEIIRTPLLLPSFSSKGFPEVKEIIQATSERIGGPCLISAYDLHHRLIEGSFDFADALFLDSGGYEAGKDVELSDLGLAPHEPLAWDMDRFKTVVDAWSNPLDTVIISYDHPKERVTTAEQIARADRTIPRGPKIFREILFKPEICLTGKEPEPVEALKVNVPSILDNIHEMHRFNAIGVTEKEIGQTVKERMINIARIRMSLIKAGMDSKPIHIFGSLDTVATQLYFVAGADVFDGLTWLRFSYFEGMTIYRQNYSTLQFGIDMPWPLVDLKCCWDNVGYMKDLELEMRSYLAKGVKSFSYHRETITKALEAVKEEIGA